MKNKVKDRAGVNPEEKTTAVQSGDRKEDAVHLMLLAIDPKIPRTIQSVTFNFANKGEGLQTFNILSTLAKNRHKSSEEDDKKVELKMPKGQNRMASIYR